MTVPLHPGHIKLTGVPKVYGAIVTLLVVVCMVLLRGPARAGSEGPGGEGHGGEGHDGLADLALILETVASEAPVELIEGATIQIQASYFAASQCGDDGVPCPDSFVVRDARGRLILAMLQSSGAPLLPAPALFEQLGVEAATWLAPLELGLVDDRPCPGGRGPCGGEKIRLAVDVGVEGSAVARFVAGSAGYVADQFFISVNNLERWEPAFYCVDELDVARVFVSRQACAKAGDCPTDADAGCELDEDRGQDQAYLRFAGYGHAPTSVAYTAQCVILGVEAKLESSPHPHTRRRYELDCGAAEA